MCVSARADFDNTWEQSVVRYATLRTVEERHCPVLTVSGMPLPKQRRLTMCNEQRNRSRGISGMYYHVECKDTCTRKAAA